MNKKKPELKYEELRELYDEAFIELTDCLQENMRTRRNHWIIHFHAS